MITGWGRDLCGTDTDDSTEYKIELVISGGQTLEVEHRLKCLHTNERGEIVLTGGTGNVSRSNN